MITLGNSSPPSETFSEGSGPRVIVLGQLFLPEFTRDKSAPLEANSNVVSISPLADVVATSPLVDGQEVTYIPDDLDMVPNDAFIGPDMVPSDIENFLLNSDEDWSSNLLVEMDKYIARIEPSCDQLLQPNPEVDTAQEMDLVPLVDDLMQESEDKPLKNASLTAQVQ
ncbi:hypothetical protein Tco_0534864 [Tanacetum coccineum]